jgi:hypothetical protein
MMLFDPEVGPSIKGRNVAGRQGGGRKIRQTMREIMSTTVKQQQQQKTRFEECQVAPGARPEECHLTPEVKVANKIVCDHVWDKLYPPFL